MFEVGISRADGRKRDDDLLAHLDFTDTIERLAARTKSRNSFIDGGS